ncbi:MAG: hypothetical protein J5636_00620 [Clostridiales bacterium]|nr:hypothetical protein [Clostridiales bacterium]
MEYLPDGLFVIPAGLVVGILLLSIVSYYSTLWLTLLMGKGTGARVAGLVITGLVFVALTIVNSIVIFRRKQKKQGMPVAIEQYRSNLANNCFYVITIAVFFILSALVMGHFYQTGEGQMVVGGAVRGDVAVHSALASSFSKGYNFPTQYPFFASEGIHYHFMFDYFCGTLAFLGLPIDLALNIPSILVMVSFLVLSGLLAMVIAKKKMAFALMGVLILFRSSFNFFIDLGLKISSGKDLIGALREMMSRASYFGLTDYESWGVWTINIFGNQRHLSFGFACILILILLFLPYVRAMCRTIVLSERSRKSVISFFFSKESWIPEKTENKNSPWKILILALLFICPLPYFHGSALISVLLILALMAVFSKYRILYVIIAAVAWTSSYIQTKVFAGAVEKVFDLRLYIGFYSKSAHPRDILIYLLLITGLTLVLSALYVFVFLRSSKDRSAADTKMSDEVVRGEKHLLSVVMWFAFLVPLVFAFTFQPSIELLANHKIIQVTVTLMDAFVCAFLVSLWYPKNEEKADSKTRQNKMLRTRIFAGCLLFVLTISAVFEWMEYFNLNKIKSKIDYDSEMVEWICDNTETDDVFLTPDWDYATFFFAGRATYFGYMYYAWSGGYDVSARAKNFAYLVSGCNGNIEEFRRICNQEGIQYFIASPDYEYCWLPDETSVNYDPAFFAENLTPAVSFPEYNVIIYRVSEV